MPNKLPSRLAVLLGILIKDRYIPTSDAAWPPLKPIIWQREMAYKTIKVALKNALAKIESIEITVAT